MRAGNLPLLDSGVFLCINHSTGKNSKLDYSEELSWVLACGAFQFANFWYKAPRGIDGPPECELMGETNMSTKSPV
jgi:hypothetical protein